MPKRETTVEILGFPVRVRGEPSCSAWRFIRRGPKPKSGAKRPAVTVEFVADARSAAGGSASVLRGSTFVLGLKKRELRLEPPVSWRDLARTALFVIGLLAEHHGPFAIARTHSRGLAPLLLHSSAVLTRRGALIFCGHSTFGKTTIATKLLRGYPLINEDLNILLVGPFGKSSRKSVALAVTISRQKTAMQSPLVRSLKPLYAVRGLFWLRKADGFKFEPLGNAEAAANLLNPIFDQRRPENAAHRLKLVRMLLETCPCRRLCFRKERPALLQLLRESRYL